MTHTSQTQMTALSDAGLAKEQIMSALEDILLPRIKAFSVLINDWLLNIKTKFKSLQDEKYFLTHVTAVLIFTNTLKIFKEVNLRA